MPGAWTSLHEAQAGARRAHGAHSRVCTLPLRRHTRAPTRHTPTRHTCAHTPTHETRCAPTGNVPETRCAPDTPRAPLTGAGALSRDVERGLRLAPGLPQGTLRAVGDAVGAADLQGRGSRGWPRCLPHCPLRAGRGRGPHRAAQDALAAEVADTRPVLRVLVPDAAALPAQVLLTLAVLARAGAPGAALRCGKAAGSPAGPGQSWRPGDHTRCPRAYPAHRALPGPPRSASAAGRRPHGARTCCGR